MARSRTRGWHLAAVLPAFAQVYRPDDAAHALRRADEHLRRYVPR